MWVLKKFSVIAGVILKNAAANECVGVNYYSYIAVIHYIFSVCDDYAEYFIAMHYNCITEQCTQKAYIYIYLSVRGIL